MGSIFPKAATEKVPALWYTYVLYSVTTGRTYTGVTTEPNRRLEEHNRKKKGAKATKGGRPWVMVRCERYKTKVDAMKREAEIKKLGRKFKLLLCGLSA
jgi:putative endonuclease